VRAAAGITFAEIAVFMRFLLLPEAQLLGVSGNLGYSLAAAE
jgi:hypothetical protein